MRNLVVEVFRGKYTKYTVLFLLGVVTFLNSLPNDPSFADETGISEYEVGIGLVESRPERTGYSILAELSYCFEAKVFGYSPLISRAINLFLFGLCGALLYLLLQKLVIVRKVPVLFLGVLLFIVHPLNTAVMGPFSVRGELLGFIFSIASILATVGFFKRLKAHLLVLAVLLWATAYTAGPEWLLTALLLPMAPLNVDGFGSKRRWLLWFAAVLLPAIGVFGLITNTIAPSDFTLNPIWEATVDHKYPTIISLIGLACFKLVWPFYHLSVYGYGELELVDWFSPLVIVSVVIVAALLGLAIGLRNRNTALSLSSMMLFVGLVMSSNFFHLKNEAFSESNLLLATAGFSLMLSHFICLIIPDNSDSTVTELFAGSKIRFLAVPLILMLSYFTIDRNFDWLNTYMLTRADIEYGEHSAPLQLLTGKYYIAEAERYPVKDYANTLESAERHFRSAAAIYPGWVEPKVRLGNLLLQKNELAAAWDLFNKGIEIQPSSVDARIGLATALAKQGETGKAIEEFGNVLRLEPTNLTAMNEIVSLYFTAGDIDGAEVVNKRFFQLHPNTAEPNIHQGNILLSRQDTLGAIQYYIEALSLDQGNLEFSEFVKKLEIQSRNTEYDHLK